MDYRQGVMLPECHYFELLTYFLSEEIEYSCGVLRAIR